jgi:hypothetical protein
MIIGSRFLPVMIPNHTRYTCGGVCNGWKRLLPFIFSATFAHEIL